MNFVYMNTHGRNVFCTHGQGLHGMLVLFNLHEHWNGNSIILMKSLAAREVASRCNR